MRKVILLLLFSDCFGFVCFSTTVYKVKRVHMLQKLKSELFSLKYKLGRCRR